VNFANFERAVTWVFAAVSWLSEDCARMTHSKLGTFHCVALIDQMIAKRNWPSEATERVYHFTSAARVLISNRNLLMHSVVVDGWGEKANLYRTNRRGEPQMVQASLEQIRAVADDLVEYFNFGLVLANCIATKIWKADQQAGMLVIQEWPDTPNMPNSITKSALAST
jgi:hypothetical protein